MELTIHKWLDRLLQTSKHEFVVLESHLSPEMHAARGEVDQWSAKDVFTHLTYWLEVFSHNIEARIDSETLVDTGNYKELNRKAWESRNKLGWCKVRSDLENAFENVKSSTHRLTAAQLTNASEFSIGGRPLVVDYMYELIEHPMHHWMILYSKASANEMATEMLNRVEERVSQKGLMKWSLAARKNINKYRRSNRNDL